MFLLAFKDNEIEGLDKTFSDKIKRVGINLPLSNG